MDNEEINWEEVQLGTGGPFVHEGNLTENLYYGMEFIGAAAQSEGWVSSPEVAGVDAAGIDAVGVEAKPGVEIAKLVEAASLTEGGMVKHDVGPRRIDWKDIPLLEDQADRVVIGIAGEYVIEWQLTPEETQGLIRVLDQVLAWGSATGPTG